MTAGVSRPWLKAIDAKSRPLKRGPAFWTGHVFRRLVNDCFGFGRGAIVRDFGLGRADDLAGDGSDDETSADETDDVEPELGNTKSHGSVNDST